MSIGRRLDKMPGEWIDRSKPIRFRFESVEYAGFAGDTITSALVANGVRMLGRSFKYHRPRGVYSLANHDVNAMFEGAGETNIRGDVTPITPGAEYKAVNTFGGLKGDRLRIMDLMGRFLPVGFYYKTFFRPRSMFPFWERQIRAAAGLGAVNGKSPRTFTPKRYDWCDVLVIGAGPAGLSAAIAAAKTAPAPGARVVCIDENARPGGSLTYQHGSDPRSAGTLDRLLAEARALPNLEIRTHTTAAGYYADHWVALVDDKKLTKMRARSVVIAQGAHEQPAVFRHNDLPGVMLASAAQRLMRRYAVRPFDTGVVLTANTDGYRAALDLLAVGVKVAAVVDLRPSGEASDVGQAVAKAGVPIHRGTAIYEALSSAGRRGIWGVSVCPIVPTDHSGGKSDPATHAKNRLDRSRRTTILCDGIAMSVGWSGADGLLYQAGGRMAYSDELNQFVPHTLPPGVFAAGRVNGVFDLEARLADGRRAGAAAVAHVARTTPGAGAGAGVAAEAPHMDAGLRIDAGLHADVPRGPVSTHPYPIFYHPRGKAFVDLDEDVQLKDLINAEQEGFDNIELLKRYSTFGMGPSQGKIANTNTIRILARLRGQTVGATGTPTARPFWHPVRLDHLGGRGFHPHRLTPLHSRHIAAGAVMMDAGEWKRPAYYAPSGGGQTREACIRGEVQAVRQRVGIIDVGTLGKLEISGPDAGEFIERIYTGKFKAMKVGTTRYGLMCDESGVIIDDGVIGRLADDRFYVTTTTTASGAVYREMQRYAIVWGLTITLVNATGLYAGMNLAGPESRKVLAGLVNFDVSEEAFPYLALREGEILGVPARFMRVGFVGELGYEVHVPAYWAARVWDGIMQAGASANIRPFGVEAQRVLRLEKAHAIIGQDTDGLATPFDAGMEWAIKDDKPFFIGQRSLRVMQKKPRTRRLVGFTLAENYAGPLPKECHLVIDGQAILGRVTSVTQSPTLNRVIGMAYVDPSRATPGSTFMIRIDGGAMVTATVVPTPFYDPKQERQKPGGRH